MYLHLAISISTTGLLENKLVMVEVSCVGRRVKEKVRIFPGFLQRPLPFSGQFNLNKNVSALLEVDDYTLLSLAKDNVYDNNKSNGFQ